MEQEACRVRRHLCFYGQVQGVGFRFRASMMAKELELTGWVRNVDDYVEMEVQGCPEDIERLVSCMGQDSWISIDRVEAEELPLLKKEKDFRITW